MAKPRAGGTFPRSIGRVHAKCAKGLHLSAPVPSLKLRQTGRKERKGAYEFFAVSAIGLAPAFAEAATRRRCLRGFPPPYLRHGLRAPPPAGDNLQTKKIRIEQVLFVVLQLKLTSKLQYFYAALVYYCVSCGCIPFHRGGIARINIGLTIG
jgi:hypothetical protein